MSDDYKGYEGIAIRAYENGWRSVRDLVYLIPDAVLEEKFPWAFGEDEDE